MCPLTPKSSSRFRRCSAFCRSSSSLSVRRRSPPAGALRSDTGGSWNVAPGWANPKISCFARRPSAERGRSSPAPPGPPMAAHAPRSGRAHAPEAARPATGSGSSGGSAMAGAGGAGRGSTTTGRAAAAGGAATGAAARAADRRSRPRRAERGQARDQGPREARVGRLGDAQAGDRHEREEQDQCTHVTQGAPERARHGPAEPPAPVEPDAAHRPRELGQEPRDRQEAEHGPDRDRERPHGERPREGRERPHHQHHRHEVGGVADGREERPPHPEPHDADPRLLVHPAKRRVVGQERDAQVRGEPEGDDALGLAEPPRGDLGLGGPGLRLRHQASRTIGQHDRLPVVPLADEAAERAAEERDQRLAPEGRPAPLRGQGLPERGPRLLQHGLGLALVDPAPRDDLRPRDDRAGAAIHGHGDDDHPVLGEELAVAEHHRPHVPDPFPVDQHAGERHALEHARAGLGELDPLPVLDDEDVLGREGPPPAPDGRAPGGAGTRREPG